MVAWVVILSPLCGSFTAVHALDTKNVRGADENSPKKEIVEGSIFDGMVSFASRLSPVDSSNGGGVSMPDALNKS